MTIESSLVSKLLNRLQTIPYAELYLEELSLMRSPKPNIDVERRRMSINLRHRIKLQRSSGVEFFKIFEDVGLGKLKVIKARGDGNTKFHWTYQSTDCIELATVLLDSMKTVDSTKSKYPFERQSISETQNSYGVKLSKIEAPEKNAPKKGPSIKLQLSSGNEVEIALNDLEELKQLLGRFGG